MHVVVICMSIKHLDYFVQNIYFYMYKHVFFPPTVWNLKVFVIMETKKLIGKPLQPARPARHLTSPPGEYIGCILLNINWLMAN